MATKLLSTSVQAFCFRPCSVAIAFARAPFVMALAPFFIDFIGGSMAVDRENGLDDEPGICCK